MRRSFDSFEMAYFYFYPCLAHVIIFTWWVYSLNSSLFWVQVELLWFLAVHKEVWVYKCAYSRSLFFFFFFWLGFWRSKKAFLRGKIYCSCWNWKCKSSCSTCRRSYSGTWENVPHFRKAGQLMSLLLMLKSPSPPWAC